MRYGFIRRIAFLLALLVAFAVGGATFLFWLLASLLGAVDLPGTFERGAVLVALLFGLAGIVLTARAVRRLAGPVGEVIEAAERLESGDLAARAEVQGPREVRALARAFNAMAARLETNEAQRKRLLADVTHELRTPLTIAQGDLEALLDGVYPADEAHLRAILQETHVLARLIDDLRTLSLAETGALALHREPTDLGALASATVASFREQAGREGIALEVGGTDGLPLVEADPVRTREIVTNLLANAIRYTPRGGSIAVELGRAPDGAVTCSVRDTGSGIPADALPHVFERFTKSADSPGAGLGLAIAKSLVAAHGGEIRAESGPAAGTRITFTLPAAV